MAQGRSTGRGSRAASGWPDAWLRWLVTLIVAGVAAQLVLAGAGAFGATDYDVHQALGVALVPLGAVAFSFASAARRHRTTTLVVGVLLALQIAFAALARESEPWVGALHGLNALVVAAVAGGLAGRLWSGARTRPGA